MGIFVVNSICKLAIWKTKIEWFLILLHCYMWILFGVLCLKMGAVCQNCICLFPDADLLATLPTAYLTGPDQPRDVPCYFRKPNRIVKSPLDIDTYTILHYEEGTSRYIKVPQVPSVQKFRQMGAHPLPWFSKYGPVPGLSHANVPSAAPKCLTVPDIEILLSFSGICILASSSKF